MSNALNGRAVLLTGAAGGIGRSVASAFLSAGANVMAADVDEAGLEALSGHAGESVSAGRLVTRKLDVADNAACRAAVEATVKQFGSMDILINNGAVGMQSIREDCMTSLVAIDEITPEVWNRFVSVNLSGPWYLTRAAIPHMREQRWGRIINVTTSFFTMLRGRFHPYGPVKAGFEAMSAGHAQEFARTGITVNVVVPGGPADTAMVPAISGYKREDLIPPAKMAGPMLWLCTTDADAVSGRRYVAANWDCGNGVAAARAASEAPIGWPDLAGAPVWPGGKPEE